MFNNHNKLETVLPFPTTDCVMRGKKERQVPSSCPGNHKWASQQHPQRDTATAHSNTSRFCLKNLDFSSLITSGICRNRDRLEVTCWLGFKKEHGLWTSPSICAPAQSSWRMGQTPCSAGLFWSPSASQTGFVLPRCTELHCKQLQKYYWILIKKGQNKTPKEMYAGMTEGKTAMGCRPGLQVITVLFWVVKCHANSRGLQRGLTELVNGQEGGRWASVDIKQVTQLGEK